MLLVRDSLLNCANEYESNIILVVENMIAILELNYENKTCSTLFCTTANNRKYIYLSFHRSINLIEQHMNIRALCIICH